MISPTVFLIGISLIALAIIVCFYLFAIKRWKQLDTELKSLEKECDDFKLLLHSVRSKAEIKLLFDTKWKELVDKIDASPCSRQLNHRILNILGRMNGMLDVYIQYEKPTENIKTS